jgi:hypothetical protein
MNRRRLMTVASADVANRIWDDRISIRLGHFHRLGGRHGNESHGGADPPDFRLPACALLQRNIERRRFGLFTPSTPLIFMMTWLLFSGFVRSLEFTSLNAIVFADIDASKMSRAVSFSSAAQQLSLSVGVAAGAGALQGFALLNPGAEVLALENFILSYDGNCLSERGCRILAPAACRRIGSHREPRTSHKGHRASGTIKLPSVTV